MRGRVRGVTLTTTSPFSVNLTELLSRFTRIWRSRVTSPTMKGGISLANSQASSSLFSEAFSFIRSIAESTHSYRSKGCLSSSMRAASILEKSKISLMIVSSASPLLRIVSAKSRCSALSGVSSSSPLMPIMAFIGVRISWLIIARKEDLACVADSAASLAFCSSCSASLRSVMSRMVSMAPANSPFELYSAEAVAYR